MKTIVVCGDLVWDTHIARLPSFPKGYHQPHLQSQLTNRHGGAWYLRDVIAEAFEAAKAEALVTVAQREAELSEAENNKDNPPSSDAVTKWKASITEATRWADQFNAQVLAPVEVSHLDIEEGKGDSLGVAKGFSVWEWFEGLEKSAKAKIGPNGVMGYKWKEGEACPGAWRIKEFLGCQAANWSHGDGVPSNYPAIQSAAPPPDLVVVDDLGLGFAENPKCWPTCLSSHAGPILIKATPQFDRELWNHLLAPQRAANVTVVLAAAALRDAGAHLSRGFSWDLTIKEVKRLFDSGGACCRLAACARVIVTFGRSGAAVFSRAPRSPQEAKKVSKKLQLERFVFDPQHLEDTWSNSMPGKTFGATSVMTAAVAAHMLAEPRPSSHIPVSRGLAAGRELHRVGGGQNEKKFQLRAADRETFAVNAKQPPEAAFRSAFPRELLDPPVLVSQADVPAPEQQTLLTDALGFTSAFLTVAAEDIVRFGKEQPLRGVPRLECGKYFTVDREEIERLNTVRNLILSYKSSRADARPLSLAVFGPPGAGKSFAIKQLSETLFGRDQAVLEFNLSQFEDLDALHQAFHEVRDKSVQNKMPLVFWDEFDSARNNESLGWLKEFLAPMQDSHFVARGRAHPFGKCVFIFAGGTCRTFEEFNRPSVAPSVPAEWEKASEEERRRFKQVKGPDFVSRLRGYVNIKGPNPGTDKGDEVHVIRRALLLRSLVERLHPNILHPQSKELVISPDVLNAFLRVGDGKAGQGYLHGARSMEAIVSLGPLHDCRRFGPSELPAKEVIDLHASPDFSEKVADVSSHRFSPDEINQIAKRIHDNWRLTKVDYVFGPFRDDHSIPPRHPLMVDYQELTDPQKEANRRPARITAIRLEALGYRICRPDQVHGGHKVEKMAELPLTVLARSEHRRWMREKLMDGVAYGEESKDSIFIHKDICAFDDLGKKEKKLDYSIVKAIFDYLNERNLVLVKVGRRAPVNRGATPKRSPRLARSRRSKSHAKNIVDAKS